MYVEDLEGRVRVDREEDLEYRLQSVRKGGYGAFILWHIDKGASLWIHINKDVAYLHFFPAGLGKHPGFQPTGMSPAHCDERVHFLQTTGSEADSVTLPRETLVAVEVAYKAAKEFLHDPAPPSSITWFEL
jgi:hypothetical protein